jgi:DNA-binding transcriptional ArsR family regulator
MRIFPLFPHLLAGRSCVRKAPLTADKIQLLAERFKVLAEPARLEILNRLRSGEMSVTELIRQTGLGQANLSKHLKLLHAHGFVARRKEGVSAYYSLATSVDELCDIMTNQMNAQVTSRRRTLGS